MLPLVVPEVAILLSLRVGTRLEVIALHILHTAGPPCLAFLCCDGITPCCQSRVVKFKTLGEMLQAYQTLISEQPIFPQQPGATSDQRSLSRLGYFG